MKSLATWLCAPVIAVLLCGPVVACPARARIVTTAAAVVTNVVVTDPVAIAVFQPVLVTVPAYGAAYTPASPAPPPAPAPAPAPTASPSADAQRILDALKALDGRLRLIESKTGSPVQPALPAAKAAPKDNPALSLFQTKCASCHERAVAGEKGGGLVLLDDGKLAVLTDRQARKVLSASYAGRMPPKTSGVPALTDDEVATVATYVDAMK